MAIKEKKKKEKATLEVVHPAIEMRVCVGENAITVDQCKEMLGWTEETEDKKFGNDYLFIDKRDNRIRCLKNMKNRPLYMGSVENLIQEHLTGHWRFNGEPIIIGKYDTVLNGQHTLISLVLAEQIRSGDDEVGKHWQKKHKKPLTMEKSIIYGVDEDDDTVNTMDTCKPRSLSDVIYRSNFFASLKGAERQKAARMLDHCIRMLWHRTGASADPFANRRTHAEALDFVNRHIHILDCVSHILTNDIKNKDDKQYSISGYISPGYAAALMYMMATCDTDSELYHSEEESGNHSEKVVNLDNYDNAAKFWNLFSANSSDTLDELKEGIRSLVDVESNSTAGTGRAKIAMICNAWLLFNQGQEVTLEEITPEYTINNDGIQVLVSSSLPSFGGIDLGEKQDKEEMSEEEIAQRTEAVRNGQDPDADAEDEEDEEDEE